MMPQLVGSFVMVALLTAVVAGALLMLVTSQATQFDVGQSLQLLWDGSERDPQPGAPAVGTGLRSLLRIVCFKTS